MSLWYSRLQGTAVSRTPNTLLGLLSIILLIAYLSLSLRIIIHSYPFNWTKISNSMQSFLYGVTLTLVFELSLAKAPRVVEWNTTNYYGPDGPWQVSFQSKTVSPMEQWGLIILQVVYVYVGSDESGNPLSTVNLSPGGIYQSMIPTQQLCQSVSPVCFAASAGLYNVGESTTVSSKQSQGLVWQWGSSAAINTTGQAVDLTDTISMKTAQGIVKVPNSTISAVNQQHIYLPDGLDYSIEVGSLSLGAPGRGPPGLNFPGYLAMQNVTSSNSFSLHYGSASLGLTASLVWGGYDQNRVLGKVGSFPLFQPSKLMVPTLLDVQVGVESGQSPFIDGSSFMGLLEQNSTLKNGQPAIINPIVPYLFMSAGTCAAIAQQLPVTLHPDIGLYIWNVTDPQFRRILSSSAYLAFVFESSPDANITIKVPFQLLNLTLEPPIVKYRQSYFPCRPFNSSDGDGNYFLGKAFLQAAFIGINWETETYFMAQAPGPEVSQPMIQSIGPSDMSVSSLSIEAFATSWSKSWTLLTSQSNGVTIGNGLNANTTTTGSPPKGSTTSPHGSIKSASRPLSIGAKVGAGFGGTIAFIAALATSVTLIHGRQRVLRRLKAREQKQKIPIPQMQGLHEIEDTRAVCEMSSSCLPHEKDAFEELHEKDSHNVYEKGSDSPTGQSRLHTNELAL